MTEGLLPGRSAITTVDHPWLRRDFAAVSAAQDYRTSRTVTGTADDHALDLGGALEDREVCQAWLEPSCEHAGEHRPRLAGRR